jgi:hypothetical protein
VQITHGFFGIGRCFFFVSGVQKKWVYLRLKPIFAYLFRNAVMFDLFRGFTPNGKTSTRPIYSTRFKFLEIYVWRARGIASTRTRSSSKFVLAASGVKQKTGAVFWFKTATRSHVIRCVHIRHDSCTINNFVWTVWGVTSTETTLVHPACSHTL